jgi:transposase
LYYIVDSTEPVTDAIDPRQWLNDSQWAVLCPALRRIRNTQGPRERQTDRDFLTAIAYLVQKDLPWRALPAELGDWHAVYMRFRRWEKSRIWADLHRELDDRALRMLNPAFARIDDSVLSRNNHGYLRISERLRKALKMPVW